MKTLRSCVIVLWWATLLMVGAGTLPAASASEAPAASQAESPADPADRDDHDGSDDSKDRVERDSDWLDRRQGDDEHSGWQGRSRVGSHRHGHDLVNIGHDSHLPPGERADSVVSVLGSSFAEGDAASDVVSVLGNTTVTGSVRHSAVAVLGSTIIDGPVDGDAVAVLGNVELGPNANVGGDVVAVGGKVERDPAAQVHGNVQSVFGGFDGFAWLRPWIDHCFLYGRPFALAHGLGWAWAIALSLLVLYVGFAWLFRDGVTRCVQYARVAAGMTSLVAALITVLLTPVLLVLLCITFVGIAAVPFVAVGLSARACLERRSCSRGSATAPSARAEPSSWGHPALAVLVGGAIVSVLYLVPVLGFIVYKLLGLFGLGAVVYTLVLLARARRASASGSRISRARCAQSGGCAESGGPALHRSAAWVRSAACGPRSRLMPECATLRITPPPPRRRGITAALPRAGFWIRMAGAVPRRVLGRAS